MSRLFVCPLLCLVCLVGVPSWALAQEPAEEDLSSDSASELTVTGFVEAFYAYDFADPDNNQRPNFVYQHGRHNEFSINLALIHAGWERDRVRANIGLMAGSFPQRNQIQEQTLFQFLYDANVGVKLAEGLWVDAGLFPSHIGFESALSIQNPTLTRSMAAELTPYYLSGVRLTWEINDQFTFTGVVSNGWQNIRETPLNDNKALGTQLVYTPTEGLLLNWSTWWSDETRNDLDGDGNRLFSDFFVQLARGPLTFIVGLDVGTQQRNLALDDDDGWAHWYAASVLGRYELTPVFALNARAEYFSDNDAVIADFNQGPGPGNDFESNALLGLSLGLDVTIVEQVMWRLEGRAFLGDEDYFDDQQNNVAVTTSLAASF